MVASVLALGPEDGQKHPLQIIRVILFSTGIGTMLGIQTVFNRCVSNEQLSI